MIDPVWPRISLFALIALCAIASVAAEPVVHDTAIDDETRAEPTRIIIFGGTRGVGLEVVRLLARRNYDVSAFVRPESDRSRLESLDVKFIVGDALNESDVQAAFAKRRFSTVISTLGCRKCDAPPDYIGNRNVIDAASAAGIQHVILVSTIGAGDSEDAMPFFVKIFLRDRIDRKTRAENHLRVSGLEFTIIRPGGLKDGEPTGHSILTTDTSVMGFIRRADLARLLVDVLNDPSTFGKTYSALDPK